MVMTLAYWDIHRLAHTIHLLLEYPDANCEETKYRPQFAGDTITLLLASLACTVYLNPSAWMCQTRKTSSPSGPKEISAYVKPTCLLPGPMHGMPAM
uniref:Uncharacterized protein n=1 Tax=Panthera leo TaxID=9689 RepID=A0A8C9DCT4_PANLE